MALLVATALAAGCVGNVEDPRAGPIGSGPDRPGGMDPLPGEVDPTIRPLRRLTRTELRNTLTDLLGREITGLTDSIPAESLELLYDRIGAAQTVSTLHVEGYLAIARAITTEAMQDDALAARLMPGCDLARLGPRARPTTTTTPGSGLQAPSPSYLACYAGDTWSGAPLCPEITDPDEVLLRLGNGYVTLSAPITADGRYRIELEASAVDYAVASGGVQLFVDGAPAATYSIPTSWPTESRTFGTYSVEVDLTAGDRTLRFEQTPEAAIYIRGVSVIGPVDSGATTDAAARDACAAAFAGVLSRFWRRPITTEEQDAAVALFRAGMADGFFFDGLRMALELAIQSPDFLYHVEIGTPTGDPDRFRLDDFELASRLSYLAWQTMPDDVLWNAAERGELRTEAEVRAQAERLFNDPRARVTIRDFYEQWLGLHRMDSLTKDVTLFPEFTEAVRTAMREETDTFLDRMIWDEGATMADLLTARHTYLPPDLAGIYGLPAPAATERVDLPPERQGLLTQPSFLALQAKPNAHSPVRRGVFVLSRFLCDPPDPPPVGVDFSAVERSTARTNRERYAEHTSNPACQGCHGNIDPVGFTFESFDSLGRFRTEEGGLPIDDSGGVPTLGLDAGSLDGAPALATALAEREETSVCFARQWMRFGLGRMEGQGDDPSLDALASVLALGGIREMIVQLTTTEAFLHRVIEEEDR